MSHSDLSFFLAAPYMPRQRLTRERRHRELQPSADDLDSSVEGAGSYMAKKCSHSKERLTVVLDMDEVALHTVVPE